MINSTAYKTTLPVQYATGNATPLTKVPSKVAGTVIFRDMALTSATNLEIQANVTEKPTSTRLYASLSKKRVNVNSNVGTENPYENKVSLSVVFDPRYASISDVKADIASLLNRLLNIETEGGEPDIVRMIQGEL